MSGADLCEPNAYVESNNDMIPLSRLAVEANVVAKPSDQLLSVLKEMANIDASSALVIEDKKAVGILTYHDLLHLMTNADRCHDCTVDAVMTSPVFTVSADMSCHAAYHLMLEKGIRHIVIDIDGKGAYRVIGEKSFLTDGGLQDDDSVPRVEAIMDASPVCISHDATMLDAVRRMDRTRRDYVIVAHHGRALGILTERDIFFHRELLIEHRHTPVATVMSSPVRAIQPSAAIHTALERMEEHGVRRLVVTERGGNLRGMITLHQVIAERERRHLATLQANLRECQQQRFPGVLLDFISDGVLIVEQDTGLVVEVNQPLSDWLDYPSGTLSGMTLPELLTDQSTLPHWGIHEDPPARQTTFKSGLRRHNGDTLTVEVSIKRVNIDQRGLVVGIARDLTERAAAERALLASEQRLVQIFETNQAVKLIVDPAEGKIVQANLAASRYYGYKHDELVGMPVSKINTLDQTALKQAMSQAKGERRMRFHFKHRLASGEIRDVEVFSGPLQTEGKTLLYSIVHDITDHVRAESALRASEERLDLATRAADLGLWDWNIATDEVSYSQRWASMLGYSLTDITPHFSTWKKLVHHDDLPLAMHIVKNHLAGNSPMFELTLRMRHRDGEWRWILSRGRVVERNTEGKPLRAAGTHMDITEKRNAQEKLRVVATVFESSNEGIVITDPQTRIIEVNAAFSRITGYIAEEVIGQTPKLLKSGRHDELFYQDMWRQLKVTGRWRGEVWNRRKNGEVYPEWLSISSVLDNDGQLKYYVAVFSDITERHRDRQEIEFLAHHDALTNLPNRLLFNARLEHAIGHAQRVSSELAVMCIDLDHFKTINDSLGHALGDEVLQNVSQRVTQAMRAEDTVARIGGDEFIILLEDATPGGACEVADKLIAALKAPIDLEGNPLYLSLSLGISMYPRDGKDVDTLVKNADAAMYKAKATGRDNYQFYTPDLTDDALEQVFLQNHLRRAIEQQEFRIYYQPQVDLHSGRPFGVEALLRWQHPTEGLIPPIRFVSLLEEQGLMRQVGPWVLRQACSDYVEWQEQGVAPDTLAVNISGIQINSPGAVEIIERILHDTGMPPENLELEVTETFVMDDPESNINTLKKLRALGIRLAIDDFGTGYSSLAYLKRLPINKLKIDRSFIKDVPGNTDDEAITRAVIGLGKILNLDTIAEGIERDDCVSFLIDEGCYAGQGYLWSEPVPEEILLPWLQARKLH